MSYWAATAPATPPPPLPPLPASLERYAAAAVHPSPTTGPHHHHHHRHQQHPLGVAPGYPSPAEVRDVSPRRQGGVAAASVARSVGGGGGRDVVYSGSVVRTPTDPRGVKGAAKLLLIGVTYRGDHALQLGTAAHEVRMMQQFLTRVGFAPAERKVLVEDDPDALPTRSNILSALRWLVRGAVSGDSLFLHFVGHAGQKVADLGLSTPPAGGGGGGGGHHGGLSDVGVSSIVPLDYKLSGLVYADELRDILAGSLPAGAKLTCVFDAAPMPDALDLPHKIVLKGGDSLVTVEGSGGAGGGSGGDHPAHSEIPSTVNCLTYASETAGVGAGTLTTAFISACNATPLLSYRQLILDAGYIMQREAGAHAGRSSLGPPRPMLASSQPFELTNIFTLGCHGDRGGGAGGLQQQQRALQPPMTPKEEELARRVQYLESQLATPPRSTPAGASAGGSRRLRSPLQGGGGGGSGMGGPYDPVRGVPGGADSPPRELVYDSGPGEGKPEEEVSGAAKAVFIDCSYTGSPFEVAASSGSGGDADEMSRLQNFLMYVGFNAKVQVLTEASKAAHLVPTRRNILNALSWLVKDARSGDVLFLYYAGFSSAPVSAGDDPAAPTHSHADILQEALCPTDFFESGFISGDEVLSVLTRSLPKDAKLIVVADVCFSPRVAEIARAPTAPPKGTIVKLPYIISVSPAAGGGGGAGGAGGGAGGGGGGVTHFYDRDADYLFEGPQGRSEIVVLSAHHAENKRGLLTSALLSVWENSAQLCVGIFVSALHAQLLLRCASKDSTAFIQSTQKLYDKNLFFLGNRPQVLKQMKPPARESAQVAPLRQGGAGVAAPADAALRKANTPAGVYLIEDDPARPAAVVIKDADSAGGHVDVTLFSVEGGEVKGTIEPTYSDGERTEIAIVLSAQAAPAAAAAASPGSPDENGDVGSEGSPGPPDSPPPASPEGGGGGGEAVYTVADRTLRFPDGTTWVKKVEGGDGNAKAGSGAGAAGTAAVTPGAEGAGGGDQEVTPHRRRHATRVVAGATKALLVGVNYPGSPFELATSHEDVRTMQRFLLRQGFQSENRLLLDLPEGYDAAGTYAYSPAFASMPTRTNLVANVRWLCAGAVPGDSLVLFFSGHGDRGESIVPCDVNLSGLLQAEELHAALAQLPHGVRLTVLMDVGTGGPILSKLPYVLESHPNGGFSSKERKGSGGSPAGDADVTVLYLRSDGSGGGRFDRENNLHGALSAAFMSVLNQAGDEGVTYEQLLTAMEAAVTRRVDRGEASTGYHPHAQGVVVGVASSQKVHPTDAFALGARATAAAQPSSPFSLAAAANPYADDGASANKRAVLISCAYGGKLPGSDPALNEVHRMLQKMGFPADGVKVLTEQHSTAMPTKQNIVAFLRWLAQGSEPGDDLFLYFAGHSARLEPGPSSSGDAGVGLAPMDHHITGMLSGEELMFNLVSPLVSGVSLFCLFDTACTGTPAVLPYTMKVESDGGASFAHFPHVSRDQPAKALVQAVWTEPGKGPQAPVLPLNGQLTRSFLQTLDSFVGASTRTPKIGHVLQALGGRLEQAVPGSGHLPVYGSTRLFSEGDGFALMLNQKLAAAATPRRVAAAGPGGNSPRYGGGGGGGGPPGNHDAVVRAPVLQSPHNMPHVSPVRNGRHALHPSPAGAATPYAFAVSGVQELDDNMAGIQRTLSEALSMSKHRSHSPISPRQAVASALGGGGPQQPPPSAQSPIAPTTMRNLRLSNKDEPLGMRLNPLPPPENLGPGGAGMVVAMVTHGSAAFHAGIIPGDVVVRIASMPIRSSQDVRAARTFAAQSNAYAVAVELSASPIV